MGWIKLQLVAPENVNARAEAQREAQDGGDVYASKELPAEEKDRMRKGKGILIHAARGPRMVDCLQRRENSNSGSGSCDPFDVGDRLDKQGESGKTDGEDSSAGPGVGLGTTRSRPLLISEGSEQDVDMGREVVWEVRRWRLLWGQ